MLSKMQFQSRSHRCCGTFHTGLPHRLASNRRSDSSVHVVETSSVSTTEVTLRRQTESKGASTSAPLEHTPAAAHSHISPPISSLWDEEHVPQWSPLLALYMPFGCVLAVLRIVLWAGGVLLDLPSFQQRGVVNVWLALLGVRIRWKHLERLPAEKHVMISNHMSPCDLVALFTLPQRYVHLITAAMPARVMVTKNLPVLLRPATLDSYQQLAADFSKDTTPIHLFPEGGLTNGSAMMTFSRGFMRFARDAPVVPVALRVRTPFGLRTHTLNSSFLANHFWFSLSPYVDIEATVLPPLPPASSTPEENKGAYVQRAQQAIADELRIPISDVNIKEKWKIMKQRQQQRR